MTAEEAQKRARVLVGLNAMMSPLEWAHYDDSYHAHELELSLYAEEKSPGEWVASASYGDCRDGAYLRGEGKGATAEVAVTRAVVNAKDLVDIVSTRFDELLESTTEQDQ